MSQRRIDRRQQILEALAEMLESGVGVKITTAKLAEKVGVSEAALYRHFPSKTKMFEALIEFVEEALFSRFNAVGQEDNPAVEKCRKMLLLLLTFCERNPGITKILSGDALLGENERLYTRVAQLYDRLELQLRQTLKKAELEERERTAIVVNEAANLLLAIAEGRIAQFVRSGFKRSPTQGFNEQWQIVAAQLMRSVQI
jgi:TetR/AcrR family transcriptional regulator